MSSQWKDIRSRLNQTSQGDLINLVGELYKLSQQTQLFLETRFGNQQGGLEEYKLIIEESICPAEPWKRDVSLSTGRKAIRDYKKALGDPEGLIDLMIYYCECGVNFTNQFGDIDERFYASIESMYESTLQLLKKHNHCKEIYITRVEDIVSNTRNIGWGFHDTLSDIFEEYQSKTS